MGLPSSCRTLIVAALALAAPALAHAEFNPAAATPSVWQRPAASAAAGPDPATLCEQAIVRGAQRSGVPEAVLHAISLTETGRHIGGRLRPWPWAINREGQGYWFGTRDDALNFARQSAAAGRRSFDVSCFQINYLWHGENFPSLESMFDLDTAADYAANFLKQLYAETGDWSAAAGAYHSRTPHYASIYRARFDRMLAQASGGLPLVATVPPAEPAVEATPAAPRKSVTRMSRGPLVIRVAPREKASAEAPRVAALATRRIEKVFGGTRQVRAEGAVDAGAWMAAAGHLPATRRGSESLE